MFQRDAKITFISIIKHFDTAGIFERSGIPKSSPLAFIILDEEAQYPCKRALNGAHPGLTCLLNIRVDFSDVFIMCLLKVRLMWRMQQHWFASLRPWRATASAQMEILKMEMWKDFIVYLFIVSYCIHGLILRGVH